VIEVHEEASCIMLIRRLQAHLEKQLNNDLQKLDLTMSQAGGLAAILEAPDKQLTLKQLEKKMGLSQSVTAGILSRIEQKGYVTSYGDPNDRRIKIFCVTPLGEQLCEDARKMILQTEKQFLSSLAKAEQDDFRILLQKLLQST